MHEKHEAAVFGSLVEKFRQFSAEELAAELQETQSFKNNRQFITDCFFEVLSAGLSKVKALNPSDPFEYLVR